MYVVNKNFGQLIGIATPATSAMAHLANPANWAAAPVNTHSSWSASFPGAKIASGYIISRRDTDGKVAITASGRAITQFMTIEELRSKGPIKDSSGKYIFACCNLTISSSVGQTGSPTASPQSTGPSAGEVLTGVGAILGALATPAAGIFQTHTEARLAKEQLKQEQRQAAMTPTYIPAPQIQQGSNNFVIAAVGVGFALLAVILVMLKR